VRYLHKLFQGQDDTVAGWIRQRRLDHCRRDLMDPAAQTQGIGAIAARWGLPDAAHFSRIFKAAYGVSPTEYRWLHFPGGACTPAKSRHHADAA
jgi:AraC-like DNA-binding protein